MSGYERSSVPPLAAEDHACGPCSIRYPDLGVAEARELVTALPDRARAAVRAVPAERWQRRPPSGGWSALEYACHLRDVHVVYTIRLHRARTENRPVLEPMLNDLRARRFRYNEHDMTAVLRELELVAAGLGDEADRFDDGDWDRVATRLPGEERTARWLLRQAAHEGIHHVRDILAPAALE